MAAKPFHLGWFLQGSNSGAFFTDMARALERACFDYVLIEDSSYVGESYGGSTDLYLKHGIAVPRQAATGSCSRCAMSAAASSPRPRTG